MAMIVGLPWGQWYGLSKVSNSPIRASTSFADKRLLPFTAALQDIDATFSSIKSGVIDVFIPSARSSIISIRSSFFAIPNKLSGTALTAYSSPPKCSISKPILVKRSICSSKSWASCIESDKMIGGLKYWDVYSLDFISFKVLSYITLSCAACWSII